MAKIRIVSVLDVLRSKQTNNQGALSSATERNGHVSLSLFWF